MYLDYFSLERHPFRITPDTSLFFSGGDQGRGVVLEALLYAIETGEGILKVVGEVGSGKTMLCRMLEERLPKTTEIVYLANPKLSPDEILYAVAFELKLPVRRDTSKLLVMQQLQNYLLRQHAANRKVLVIIEEAQGMPVETLEEIRLFSNLETQRDKLMQIILFGQPELEKNLSARNIRQLRERITHSFHLHPLTHSETAQYIRFRLSTAGCPCARVFSRSAERLIAMVAGGLTRRINILADKALLAAFADNVLADKTGLSNDSTPVVGCKHVLAAIQDSEYSAAILHSWLSPLRILSATMAAALVTLFVLWPHTVGFAGHTQLLPVRQATPQEQLPQQVSAPLELSTQANINTADKTPESEFIALPIKPPIVPVPVAANLASMSDPDTATVADIASRLIAATAQHDLKKEVATAKGDFEVEAAEQQDMATRFAELSPGSVSGAGQRNLVQGRVLASIAWLHRAAGNGYTVQMLSGETNDLDAAETFLQQLKGSEMLAETYVCMSADGSRSSWTVNYGSFAGMQPAQLFVEQLPQRLKELEPFVQNISSVVCNTNNTIAALMLE